ncbi:MAG TPA: hypothetical protein VN457_03450, partial [Chlamydiales bacterium]|nr:hypothetical protein [Chlamydiales bacterium]
NFLDVWKASGSRDSFAIWLAKIENGERVPGWKELQEKDFITEIGPLSKLSPVTYLDKDQRKDYEMQVKKGNIYTKHSGSKPLHTTVKANKNNRDYIFVISPENKVYIGIYEKGVMQHSSFLSGGAVQSAGLLVMKNGKIAEITNKSGHYQPTPQMISNALMVFKAQGIKIDGIIVNLLPAKEGDNWQTITASELLTRYRPTIVI